MATPSPKAKELPNVAKSGEVSKEGIDSSIDAKTDKKQKRCPEETVAEEPSQKRLKKVSSTIAENDDRCEMC